MAGRGEIRKYAGGVLVEGFATWNRTRWPFELATAVAAIVLGWSLVGYLAPDTLLLWTARAPLWLAISVVIWLLLTVFVTAPFRIWRRDQQEKEQLREQIEDQRAKGRWALAEAQAAQHEADDGLLPGRRQPIPLPAQQRA